MSKRDLAILFGVSTSTLARYLDSFSDEIPNYKKRQRLLSAAQVTKICKHFGTV